MTQYDLLLLLSAATALFMLAAGRLPIAGWVGTLGYAAQGWMLARMAGLVYGGAQPVPASFSFEVLGQPMVWRLDVVGWFFAVLTVGSALAVSWFSAGAWGRDYRAHGGRLGLMHLAIALNVLAMLLLLGSGDLLSLFVGWELVSWASFLLMACGGGETLAYARRYMIYGLGGAMAVLGAMAIAWQAGGSLQYADLAAAVPRMAVGTLWLLALLVLFGFGVKMAVVPFHLWQGNAYAFAPMPASTFLGAISSRMGLFAILVVLFKLVGVARLDAMPFFAHWSARDLLAAVAVLTAVIPSFVALRQNDARLLLAWLGIGQGGYMLVGLLSGNELGTGGGLMHVFSHATYRVVLVLALAAVLYRTGTADLNRMGGLVVRMPLTFLALLLGIIGLAGLPPINGFVSKLLVYRSLVVDNSPILFVGTIVGTLATVMAVYKLIHNIFLGQLRAEHEEIHEAPWSMTLPMLLFSAIIFVTGVMPGLVLEWVAAVQQSLGMKPIAWTLGGIDYPNNELDMIWIVGILLAGVGIAALVFFGLGNKAKRVHQLDNYAGGHFLDAQTRYHYSDHFYAGVMHLIGGWYRNSFQWAEASLASAVETIAGAFHRLAWQKVQSMAMAVAAVLLLAWAIY